MTASPKTAEALRLGPMRLRHLPAVLRIERTAHARPWTYRVFTDELAHRDDRYYVVGLVDGRVQAYGGLMFVADEAHVTNIVVAEEERRAGLGTKVLAQLAGEAVRRYCLSLSLEVRTGNVPAQHLYRKFGFEVAGTRPGYYPETGEDALIMTLFHLEHPDVRDRLRALGASW